MSEQEKKPTGFMQELDQWTEANIIGPVFNIDPNHEEEWEAVVEQVKKAVRHKVLDSYHNGQRAGQKPVRQPVRAFGRR